MSYLNARPLIAGLDTDPGIELIHDVPARLPALLERGIVDAALVPVIDMFQAGREWQIVSDACIGSDGETLTVRVFSRIPAESIRRLHVDGDSHTSVVLARIIWEEFYGRRLDVVPLPKGEYPAAAEAILLIGDKVVNSAPIGYEVETDLGSAWKSLTSLPFVFAVWAARKDADVEDLPRRLSEARDRGVGSAGMIAAEFAPAMGWPVVLAERYLTERIKFTLDQRQREGIAKFSQLARRYDLIPAGQELVFV